MDAMAGAAAVMRRPIFTMMFFLNLEMLVELMSAATEKVR